MPGDEIVHGGATAAIGYVHEVHARLLPQQLHREVTDTAGSYRCVAQRASSGAF